MQQESMVRQQNLKQLPDYLHLFLVKKELAQQSLNSRLDLILLNFLPD